MLDNKLLIANRGGQNTRSSNLELYRIVCMLMIVAHHYVVNSGLMDAKGPLWSNPLEIKSVYLFLFGMWGKTGINCFLMITGYFMCTSNITLKKYLKLYLWVVFYGIIINSIFLVTGKLEWSPKLLWVFFPFRNIHSDYFVSSFMIWWLFIPFLNALINNISRRMYLQLLVLLITVFMIYPFFPFVFKLDTNPICWFSVIYLIAAYIRKYPDGIYKPTSQKFWGFLSLGLIVVSMISVVVILHVCQHLSRIGGQYYMVSDSNKPLALLVAVSTFMWFKNLKIPRSKLINAIGGSTFGVLLIHTNSNKMRQWLWMETVDCVGRYSLPLGELIAYSCFSILAIFIACTVIDRIRIKVFEEPFFRWFDSKKISKK